MVNWVSRALAAGRTLAVLSLEALMIMVRSTDDWMSLICLVCSLAFFTISPDCETNNKFTTFNFRDYGV